VTVELEYAANVPLAEVAVRVDEVVVGASGVVEVMFSVVPVKLEGVRLPATVLVEVIFDDGSVRVVNVDNDCPCAEVVDELRSGNGGVSDADTTV
jgi:hypothetical protein